MVTKHYGTWRRRTWPMRSGRHCLSLGLQRKITLRIYARPRTEARTVTDDKTGHGRFPIPEVWTFSG